MRMPEQMPVRACRTIETRPAPEAGPAEQKALEPAGCCVQVCVPLLGCHCVAEAPFC